MKMNVYLGIVSLLLMVNGNVSMAKEVTYETCEECLNCGTNCKYTLVDGRLTIYGPTEADLTTGQIPSGSIDSRQFASRADISSISFEGNISSIGSDAFNGVRATELKIPDTVTKIANGAFAYMYWLKDLVIPDSVTDIGHCCVFIHVSLSSITVNASNLEKYLKESGSFKSDGSFNLNCTLGDCMQVLSNWDAEHNTSYFKNAKIAVKQADGSITVYKNGDIVGYKGKRIYTIEEASKVSGQKNRFKLRYR